MTAPAAAEARARLSLGISGEPIYAMVEGTLAELGVRSAELVDVGCGSGALRAQIMRFVDRYIGVDVVRYADLPPDVEFHQLDLDTGAAPLEAGAADVAVAVETIEHLENPRALMRELARLVRPGGWVIVTTPNQLSLRSLGCLLLRGRFVAFQDANYPAHLTALLEVDLRRMATEAGLVDLRIRYSRHSRIPLTALPYPRIVAGLSPRLLSDNLLLAGQKPRYSGNARSDTSRSAESGGGDLT